MKILVISDLHITHNKSAIDYHGEFGFLKDICDYDLVLNCGDISNTYFHTYQALEDLKNKVENSNVKILSILGNHEAYGSYEENTSIEDINFRLKTMFDTQPLRHLDNNYVVIDDYVVFGGTMYTNFALYDNDIYSCIQASNYINDFNYVLRYDYEEQRSRIVTPDYYTNKFNKFLDSLGKVCNDFKDKKIIVMTHFCPSEQSIAPKYIGDSLNAYYTSNLDDFILKHDNIKLWCHGHTHNSFDYTIGQCRVVCEPYGYFNYDHELKPNEYFGKSLTI